MRDRLFCRPLLWMWMALGVASLGVGQEAGSPAKPQPAAPSDAAASALSAAATTAPMSKRQRKELLDAVDPMTEFVSRDTALVMHHRVKRRLISRAEVGRYLVARFKDDESTKRLERSELVLKKFGLLERGFDLEPFLISLLTEQIAGYYDNRTKEVNLLDWVSPAEQKPVLAHELTHALQDQTVDLEKWGDSGVHGVARTAAEDAEHLRTDELETTREAMAEGQAMVVFFDDALRGQGKTLADVPETTELLDAGAEDKGSPVMAKAPLLLRESLLFPYTDGLRFEHAILLRRGKRGAFADVLARPPSSSYEILHPEAYLAGAPVPRVAMPDVHALLDGTYEPYDVGVMGELDVRILGEVLGGKEAGERLTAAWAGGAYYAAQRRAATEAEKRATGSLVLLYKSSWRTAEAAQSFAALYALGLRHKYAGVERRAAEEGVPGEQVYGTPEGDAVLMVSGRDVLVTEGLPVAVSRQLRLLFGDAGEGGERMEARGEAVLGLVGRMGAVGVAAPYTGR